MQGGNYQIEYALGQGGFGITYRAMDLNLDRPVAIKEFYPQDYVHRDGTSGRVSVPTSDAETYHRWLQRFEREGRILAKLNHPGIVKVHALFKERDTAYLVMELLPGGTLRDELRSQPGRQLPERRVIEIMAALVDALDTVHREGVYHLDLKPDNVMLTPDRRTILVDFGAARQDMTSLSSDRSKKSTYAFTMEYAPPELIGGQPVSAASDLFELGTMLYEMLTGKRPEPAWNRLLRDTWEPTSLSAAWREMISRALRLRIEERPQTVKQWWQSYPVGKQHGPLGAEERARTIPEAYARQASEEHHPLVEPICKGQDNVPSIVPTVPVTPQSAPPPVPAPAYGGPPPPTYPLRNLTPSRRGQGKLIQQWLWINGMAQPLALGLANTAGSFVIETGDLFPHYEFAAPIAGLCLGAVVGGGQWWMLRRYFPRPHLVWWLGATIGGYILALWLGAKVGYELYYSLGQATGIFDDTVSDSVGALIGSAIVGGAQWVGYRQCGHRPSWLFLAALIGGNTIAWSVALWMFGAFDADFAPLVSLLGGVTIGLIFAGISGPVLVKQLRSQPPT